MTADTALQQHLQDFFAVLDAARTGLDEREWVAFVEIATERVGILAGRLLLAELLRREHADEERAA